MDEHKGLIEQDVRKRGNPDIAGGYITRSSKSFLENS